MKNKILNIIIYGLILSIIIVFIIFILNNNSNENNNDIAKDSKEISFVLIDNNIELSLNETKKIDYINNDNNNISFQSLNTDIATVDNQGNIKGLKIGNATIYISVSNETESKTFVCFIKVYEGNKKNTLSDIIIPDGDIVLKKGNTFKIEYQLNPETAYIKNKNITIDNNYIASYDDKTNTIKALNTGKTNINFKINDIEKQVAIYVINDDIKSQFIKQVSNIKINESNINLNIGDTKNLTYTVTPTNAYIHNIAWESSNPNVIKIDNGKITAINSGISYISLIINNDFLLKGSYKHTIKVTVVIPVSKINLLSNDKVTLKVGDTNYIKTSIEPLTAYNQSLKYISSNQNIIGIDNNKIIAKNPGKATVFVETSNSSIKTKVDYVVNPKIGYVKGDGGIWGYTNSKVKTPVKADKNFFYNLQKNGIGSFDGSTYRYENYSYDINTAIFKSNNGTTLMKFYYPENTDLKYVNTFTLLGGTGETMFNGYFNEIENNLSIIKSNGIVVLIPTKRNEFAFDPLPIMDSTIFINKITKQDSSMINTIGGYSLGGETAGWLGNSNLYKRVIIICSGFYNNYDSKNKEIIIYSPREDSQIKYTDKMLNTLANNNFTNVTVVTNNNDIINAFSNRFLIINPGDSLGTGHTYRNITTANIFAYANS